MKIDAGELVEWLEGLKLFYENSEYECQDKINEKFKKEIMEDVYGLIALQYKNVIKHIKELANEQG